MSQGHACLNYGMGNQYPHVHCLPWKILIFDCILEACITQNTVLTLLHADPIHGGAVQFRQGALVAVVWPVSSTGSDMLMHSEHVSKFSWRFFPAYQMGKADTENQDPSPPPAPLAQQWAFA